jgi:outer membrane protein assembly factor BamD (BamD/ComL family)
MCRWAIATILVMVAMRPAWGQQRFRLDQGQWQQQTQVAPGSAEGQIQAIRKALAEDRPGEARKMADAWIEANEGHPLEVEAYLLRGDAKAAQQEYYDSLFDYEYVIRVYPSSEQFVTALEREFQIARIFAGGMKRKWLGMRILSARYEAEEIFIRIQERLPGSELGESSMMALGDLYYEQAEMTSAAEAYELFLENYPRSDLRERAMIRLIYANLATFKGPEYDPTGLIEAQQHIARFQDEFPVAAERVGAMALTVRSREMLALSQMTQADWYRRRGNKVSAMYMYRKILTDYSDTAAAAISARQLSAMTPQEPQKTQETQVEDSPGREPQEPKQPTVEDAS